MLFVIGAIITSAFSYEDSYSKPPAGADFSLANLDSSGSGGTGYPDSHSGGGSSGGGYDYTPSQNYEHHDHHDHHEHHEHHEHHPEPPKGHWEQKLKWKEEWVKETKTIKKQSHETKWKSVSVPVWQDVESKANCQINCSFKRHNLCDFIFKCGFLIDFSSCLEGETNTTCQSDKASGVEGKVNYFNIQTMIIILIAENGLDFIMN